MSNLVRWDPFAELSALQKQFFGDDFMTPFKGVNIPTTDVFIKDNKLEVEAHLPHFDEKDINIQVDNNALVISAERHETEEDKDKKYVVRESSSSFYRRIALPERADTDKIQAELHDGVLKINVPLTSLPEPKKIALSTRKK
jgi:HSP20 family protein